MGVTLGIGTMKGAWFARSEDRKSWNVDGPHHKGWQIGTFGRAPGGDYLLTTGSSWYGAAIHRSADLSTWDQIVDGPAYEEGGDRKLEHVWTLHTAGDRVYAGVAEAGLFFSDDDAASWHPVPGLNDHPTREQGWQPGFGGLAAHRLLIDPAHPERMWLGISAVGLFRSEDGGETWHLRNRGVTVPGPDEDAEIGYCVHCVVADPANADTIWRQDHTGVYRTTDGADTWERIEEGLPSGFGFPIVRDAATSHLFIVPLESDQYRMPVDGRFRVYRSKDGGESWHESGSGLPEAPTYTGVLRGAMDTDGRDPGGIYFGTTSGQVWFSADSGESWTRIPGVYPRITSLRVLDA